MDPILNTYLIFHGSIFVVLMCFALIDFTSWERFYTLAAQALLWPVFLIISLGRGFVRAINEAFE